MLKIKKENATKPEDIRLIEAIQTSINMYNDDSLELFWNSALKRCNFDNHICGKAGSHIWITRRSDNQRIAIIIE